jgi:hypothetical protein
MHDPLTLAKTIESKLTGTHRVRRDEILSHGSGSSAAASPKIPSADDNNEAFSKLGQLLAFDTFTIDKTDDTNGQQAGPEEGGEDEEQEFEFRLFSGPTNPTTTTKQKSHEDKPDSGITTQKLKIRLHSPAPEDIKPGDGRFVVPFRGWQYYFTKPEVMQLPHDKEQAHVEEARHKEYEDVAVTGSQLLEWAQSTKTPGCHLPWRVFHLKPNDHRVPKPMPPTLSISTSEEKKKSKPGKKRRIILRSRAAAAGMTDAEKRNKKNREKKIRKRQKERERKAASGISVGENNQEVSGDE